MTAKTRRSTSIDELYFKGYKKGTNMAERFMTNAKIALNKFETDEEKDGFSDAIEDLTHDLANFEVP